MFGNGPPFTNKFENACVEIEKKPTKFMIC